MTEDQATPLAEMLVHGYLEAAAFSRGFSDEYGQPPTMLTKAHYLRSVVQASVNQDDRYGLGAAYAEFGRVEIEDVASGQRYLLRSKSTVAIEWAKNQRTLFNDAEYIDSEVVLLVYKFHKDGLDLAIVGTRQQVGRSRVEARAVPAFLGTWPYVPAEQTEPFNQEVIDPFGDVGDVGELGDEEAE